MKTRTLQPFFGALFAGGSNCWGCRKTPSIFGTPAGFKDQASGFIGFRVEGRRYKERLRRRD